MEIYIYIIKLTGKNGFKYYKEIYLYNKTSKTHFKLLFKSIINDTGLFKCYKTVHTLNKYMENVNIHLLRLGLEDVF